MVDSLLEDDDDDIDVDVDDDVVSDADELIDEDGDGDEPDFEEVDNFEGIFKKSNPRLIM